MARLTAGARGGGHGAGAVPAVSLPVPADLQQQFEQMLERAANRGAAVHPPPQLRIDPDDPQLAESSFLFRRKPLVELGMATVELPPRERAWTLAHELSHHWRYRHGLMRGQLLAATLLLATVPIVLVGLFALQMTEQGMLPKPAWAALGGVTFLSLPIIALVVIARIKRRDEAATDHLAALLFGEVPTEGDVQRLLEQEPAGPRWLHTHPAPASRRQAALRAAGDAAAG